MSRRGKEPKISCAIKDFCDPFKLSDKILCDIMKRLHNAIKLGLAKETHETASVKCFSSYIQDLPTGNEKGRFLAIDLGGVNFRILQVVLGPEKSKCKVDSRIYAFPEEKMTGSAEEFFNYLAECVEAFTTAVKLDDEQHLLAFFFSFPYKKTSINSGYLTRWAKRFNVSGVVGKDVGALLQDALNKRSLNIKVAALVNDTVGCLMTVAWKDPACRMGVIIGTGTNASYVEKIENVGTYEDKSKPYMIITTEWGNFGSDGVLNDIWTEIDRQLDNASLRPGSEIYEKMLSVMYVCELVRLCIVKCAEKKYLFHGEVSERLKKKGALLPDNLFEIERDEGEMLKTMNVLEILEVPSVTTVDCVNVRYITRSLCRRSANLLSAGIATLLNRMNTTPVTVAIDGGMYRNHPTYKDMLKEKVRCMVNPKIQFSITLADDECGKGVALVAAAIKNDS